MPKKGSEAVDGWEQHLWPAPVCELNGKLLRERKPMLEVSGGWGDFQVGFVVQEQREVKSKHGWVIVHTEFFHLKGFSSESRDKAIQMARRNS